MAAVALTFGGMAAVDPLAEIDLVIDPAGDNLAVNPAGDVLAVRAATTWAGKTADLAVSMVGTTSRLLVGDLIATEAGAFLGTEGGDALGLEP
jgi:hypothetical protein